MYACHHHDNLSQQSSTVSVLEMKKNNFNIVERDQWIQNGYTGLNHEMHILDDNQPRREITLKTILPKGMIKISQNK